MTDQALLCAEGVRKSFPGAGVVLGPCDLTVRREEVLAIVGPSGVGKTTLLQVLAGLLVPDSGTVSLEGRQLLRPSSRVAVVFQEYGLLPWRTALRNVAFPLEVARVGRQERRLRARQALADVGLAGAEDRYPHQLSGGMRQRTAIARAMVCEPTLLLLDEPMSALDLVARRALRRQLEDLVHQRGLSTVIVTHDLADAARMADRVAVLAGRPATVVAECELDRERPEQDLINQLIGMVVEHTQPDSVPWPGTLEPESELPWILT